MADCTVSDVVTGAMSLLADADGEITQEIIDDFKTGYGDMMALAIKLRLPRIKREIYVTLPANQGVLFQSQLGVTDFAEPTRMWERGTVFTTAVTGTTDGTPITVNATAHGRATNDRVELNGIQGVPDWVNRDWFITVLNANAFTLNGSITCGANGTGGTVNFSLDQFVPMNPTDTLPPNLPALALGSWLWQENALYFTGSLQSRQLWIEYLATDTPPVSGVIGFANGRELNFLKHSTAAHFAPKRQMPMGPQLMMMAYGPSGEPDGSGGMLRALINPMLMQKQGIPRQPQRYHRRRGQFPSYG